MVAAVLLGLLGVPADEISADYHATAGAMAAFVDWLTLEHPEALDAMTSQPPEYLEAPIEAMDGVPRRGRPPLRLDARAWRQHLGIDDATIDRLRAAILD